jgi:diguanylate cyclase (GGDEF)-like protein/PAS domain S-box-containing protein
MGSMNTWLTDARAFESLFSASPSGIVAMDRDFRVIDANPASTLLSGYEREELAGRDIRSLANPPLRTFVDDAYAAAAQHKTLQRDITVTRKDGRSIVVEATSVPVLDTEEPVRLFLLFQDATWRHEAEQRFRSLFERNPIPAVLYDTAGRVVDVNDATLEQTGYTRDFYIGQPIGAPCPDPVRRALEHAFEEAMKGLISSVPGDVRGADGQMLRFQATFLPRIEAGKSTGVYAFFANVTSQSRASEELAQTRLRFQLLFEHNPSIVLAVNTEQHLIEINPAGLRISGYRLEEIRGRSVSEFVPPSQRDRVRQFLAQAIKGETVSFPVDAYSVDGRVMQYEATALPIIQQQRIVGAYALMENVTDRMRAERTVAAQREEILDLEHDFQSLFSHNPDGVCLLSLDGGILDINQAVAAMSSRTREQIVGQNFQVFLAGHDLERGWSFFRRAVEGESLHFEITSTRGDGSPLYVEATLFPKYAQGLVVGVYAVFQDITDRKVVHRKLELQAQRMRDLYLLATTPEYTDAQVMSTLQTGCRLLGLESGAIVDCTEGLQLEMRYDSLEVFAGEDSRVIELARTVLARREPVAAHVGEPGQGAYGTWIGSRLVVGGNAHGVLLFFSRTQREQPFEEIDLDTIALMAALVASALERRRSRSHLRTLAYYDSLTGLPNRLFFQERLRDSLVDTEGRARPVAVLYFDLDRFKDINDTLGHAMGDRFLQMVAHRLVRLVGDNGTVARMGGDEFIVLLRDIDGRQDVQRVAESLLLTIEEPFRIDGYEQFMTTSIGMAMAPEDGRDDQSLIKHADIAMYRVKDQGGNGFLFYDQAFEAPLRTRRTQEKHLRRAIELQQFVLHYQPIIDVAANRIVAVEALVRWNHPQRGLVLPDEFIPVAEASGLITQLGDWVMSNAAAQLRRWQEHAPLSLAVNISARQFHDRNLCERLLELIREAGLDPKRVEIEITESMALADVAQSIETVHKLKSTGVAIAVDDFGTGHSSLSYLRRFEVDYLKIDRSFVAGIGNGSSDETIVKAIIAMGHSLGLTVVAEGVEKTEQLDFLRAHQCDRAQGYLFSRPVDAQHFEAVLDSWRGTVPQTG